MGSACLRVASSFNKRPHPKLIRSGKSNPGAHDSPLPPTKTTTTTRTGLGDCKQEKLVPPWLESNRDKTMEETSLSKRISIFYVFSSCRIIYFCNCVESNVTSTEEEKGVFWKTRVVLWNVTLSRADPFRRKVGGWKKKKSRVALLSVFVFSRLTFFRLQ